MTFSGTRATLLTAVSAGALCLSMAHARAEDPDARFNAIEKQIEALQAELHSMKHDLAAKNAELAASRSRPGRVPVETAAEAPPAAAPLPVIPSGYVLVQGAPGTAPGSMALAKLETAPVELPPGQFKVRGVTVTLGGFIEAAGIWRSRNETADISSSFNGIPLRNAVGHYESENRFTARQSRVSLDAKANIDPVSTIEAYGEADFQGAAPTSNSNQSNSYVPRLRQAYAEYDRSDDNLHLLAGQAWSLITMDKKGIDDQQSDYNVPLTIDAAYVPGFNWLRVPQFRISKSFADKQFWLAASLESPQALFAAAGPNGVLPSSAGTITTSSAGGSGFYSGNNYSVDVAPDVIVKAAYDQKWGHLEAYGVMRFLRDRVSTLGDGSNNTTAAGGGGAAALFHVIPKVLDLQASALVGEGIGRYGAANLPDAVVGPNGTPRPIKEVEALAGFVVHPMPTFDWYNYAGLEREGRTAFNIAGKGYGLGSPLYSNTSCDEELGSSSNCVGNTRAIEQATTGVWWKVLHSPDYGSVQLGVQYSYTHRSIFSGIGGAPKTDDNMLFFSIRYYPFADTAPGGRTGKL